MSQMLVCYTSMTYMYHVMERLEKHFVFFNQQYEIESKVTGFF